MSVFLAFLLVLLQSVLGTLSALFTDYKLELCAAVSVAVALIFAAPFDRYLIALAVLPVFLVGLKAAGVILAPPKSS